MHKIMLCFFPCVETVLIYSNQYDDFCTKQMEQNTNIQTTQAMSFVSNFKYIRRRLSPFFLQMILQYLYCSKSINI